MLFLRILFYLIVFSVRHVEYLMPVIRSLWYARGRMRVSIAAILLIEKDGRYVLIKNRHRPHWYAPIGGVLKHSEVIPDALHAIEWHSDHTRSNDPDKIDDMRCDLRGFIKAWRLLDFLVWFNGRGAREGDQAVIRELREELAEGGFGKSWRNRASDVRVEHVRRVFEGPRAVENRSYACQFRVVDVYKIDSACKVGLAMVNEIVKRASRSENSLILVTKDEIFDERIRHDGSQIAGHATYFFTSDWHGREPLPYH